MDNSEQTPDELLKTADQSFQDRQIEQALVQYQTALSAAKAEFNRPVEVEALAQISRMLLILGRLDDARKFLDDAAARAESEDSMGWSRYLGVKGRLEWKSNQLAAARFTFAEMFEYCTTHELWSRAIDAANMMAIVSEDTASQIQWSKRGIEMAENSGVESWLGPLWNNLATTYFDQKNYSEALEAFIKARDYHWHYSNENAKLFADYHIGMTHRFLGQYDLARKWLRPVLAWAERVENHSAMAQALEDLGESDIAEGNLRSGVEFLERARDAYQIDDAPANSPELWKNLLARIEYYRSQL